MSDIENILERCEQAIDSQTGLIASISELASELDDPRLFYYSCVLAEVSRYLHSYRWLRTAGGGVGLNRSEAKLAAIGECIERYCCMAYDSEDLVLASFGELEREGFLVAKPSDFVLFSESQYNQRNFPFARFEESTEINWIWGYSLIKRKPILVPACMVFLPYAFPKRDNGEAIISPTISTGLSCRTLYDEAILYGLFEVVERDAIMLTWYYQLSPPRVDLRENEWIQEIFKERFFDPSLEYHVFDITTDITIPTMLGLRIHRGNSEATVVTGSATHSDPKIAVLKSLFEIAQVQILAKNLSRMNSDYSYKEDFSDIIDFDNHVHLYAKPEMLPQFDFLFQSSETVAIDKVESMLEGNVDHDLHYCLDILAGKNYDVIALDLTTDDVRDLGLFVVKTIVPQLQPLNGNHNHQFLGGKRLNDYSMFLKERGIKMRASCLNSYPHPFS